MIETYIVVKNQFEGVHRYKDAPKQVDFLRDYHRHIFTIKSKIQVFHDDRELEFIIVKRFIDEFINKNIREQQQTYWFMDNLSCEQVCFMIYSILKEQYGKTRKISIEVSEDGENSAVIEE